ncbi:MAG: hypothetical protein ACKOEO_15630, partial [Planctomycetaceae bacterium]
IRQTFGSAGQLLSETYEWSGRDSRIEVVAAGRVTIGADTVDIYGEPVKKGVFLRSSKLVSIVSGSHSSGTSVEIYPGGGVSAADADGEVLITAPQDVDILGYVAAGGDILLVQNSSGETIGYEVPSVDGSSRVAITAGHQIRVGQVLAAGQFVTLEGGLDPLDDTQPFSGIGVLLQGTAQVFTSEPNAAVLLRSASGISVLTPAQASTERYAIHAAGAGSAVVFEVPASGTEGHSKVYIGNRIFAEDSFLLSSGGAGGNYTIDLFELDLAGAIEVGSTSLSITSATELNLRGDLISHAGDVSVLAPDGVIIRSRVRAGGDLTIDAGSGSLTIAPSGRVDSGETLELVATGDVILTGPVGSVVAPKQLNITSVIGTIQLAELTGNLKSSAGVALAAPRIFLDGTLTTTGATPAAGDFEIQINAAEVLRMTGQFNVAGSVQISAPAEFGLYNFTGSQTGNSSVWQIAAAGDLSFGRIVQDQDGRRRSEGVRIQGVNGLQAVAAGTLTVQAGAQLSVSGDDGRLRLSGEAVTVAGTLLGGVKYGSGGEAVWTGRSASVELAGRSITIGGTGPDAAGTLVTRGGVLEASGEILLTTSGTTGNREIVVNSLRRLRTMPKDAAGVAVATPAPGISLNAADAVRVFGILDAAGTGADLQIRAAGKILLDGLLRAADDLIVSSTSSATDSVVLSQLLLKSDSAGRLLDAQDRLINIQGYLIDADGNPVDEDGELLGEGDSPVIGGAPIRLSGGSLNGETVSLTSAGGIQLSGQVGELSVAGDRLVSGSDHLTVRGTGNVVVSGRLQTQQTIDVRSAAGLDVTATGVVLAGQRAHVLGETLQVAGYVSSPALVILSGESEVLVTGTVQSGDVVRVHAGVSATWTDAQLYAGGLTASQLQGGNITVRDSGILDAVNRIEVASGGSFSLSASAVVTPNLRSILTPVIVQREKTVDVVVGTRQVAAGTKTVEETTLVETQVTEQVGTQTVRIGTKYHTLDVQLVQEGYYNGSLLREYFVEKVDYQNTARSWNTAPVMPWSSYHAFPDGTVQNIVLRPRSGGQQVAAPESELTFAQLTDDQRSVVVDFLGFRRLFQFRWTNARAHQTVNGNTTIIPWTPDWVNDGTIIASFNVPGLSDKYVRLPEGAREDFLRIVSQGFRSGVETVGRYRDRTDVRYTQLTSQMTDNLPDRDDFDNSVVSWQVEAVSSSANPYGLRDGQRQYEIFDGRLISGAAGQDRSVQHPGVPIWYGSTNQQTGVDVQGLTTVSPQGYLADSALVTEGEIFHVTKDVPVGLERLRNVFNWNSPAYDQLGIMVFAPTNQDQIEFLFDSALTPFKYNMLTGQSTLDYVNRRSGFPQLPPWSDWFVNGVAHPDYNKSAGEYYSLFWPSINAEIERRGYTAAEISMPIVQFEKYISWWVLGGEGGVGVTMFRGQTFLNIDMQMLNREDFIDYDFHWIGKWHDVTDRRDEFFFEWVTKDEDVFGTVPRYATVTKTVPVVQQIQQTIWETQNIIQQQTMLVTERIEQTVDGLSSAEFANESLRAGASISIQAGEDASFIGLTRASAADSVIDVIAGRDVTLDGALPEDAGENVAAAVADFKAGLRVDVRGGRNVLMKKDAVLFADDGNAATETGVVRLFAGQTLTVESDAFGGHEVYLHAGGDVEMKSKLTSGHLLDVKSGLGSEGIGSVITNEETELLTLGSEIVMAAGPKGGNLLLTNAQIFTAGPITLDAPAGSLIHTGGQILANSLSATVKNGITANLDVRTVSAAVTGSGDVNFVTSGAVTLASVSVASGSVAVQGFGDITAQNITTSGGSGGISLTGLAGNLTLGNISAAGTLDVQSDVGAINSLPGSTVAAADVNYVGQFSPDFTLASDDVTLISRRPGDVVLNYTGTGPLTLRQVYVLEGNLIVNTPGDLIVLDARLLSNTGDFRIQLNAGGNVTIDYLDAGDYAVTEAAAAEIRAARGLSADARLTSLNNVQITAGGFIGEAGSGDSGVDIVGNRLTLSAGAGISGLKLSANEVTSATTSSGSISLSEVDGVAELSAGLTVGTLSAPAGITLTAAAALSVSRAVAVGGGGDISLTAQNGPLILAPGSGQTAVLTAGGDIVLRGGDIAWGGVNTAGDDVSAVATGSLFVSSAAFSLTADEVSFEAGTDLSVKGAISGSGRLSFVALDGSQGMSAAIQARPGAAISHLTFQAGGDLNVLDGSFPAVTTRLQIQAGRELAQSDVPLSWLVTGSSGELVVNSGGNLTIGRVAIEQSVLKADHRVSISSTGYINASGVAVGGNLAVVSLPEGYSSATPRTFELYAKNYLHIHESFAASEKLSMRGGQTMLTRLAVLRNMTEQMRADGPDSPAVLEALARSIITLRGTKLELPHAKN